MATVSLLNVSVRNNPAPFNAPYEFEITFECLEPLQKDLEWKLTYVGSATSSEHDQELDSLLVGPIPVGVNKFVFEADPPNTSRIPGSDVLGVTVILLTCSYDEREFVRVGYYVNNEYGDPSLNEEPPKPPLFDQIRRNILADKPRVTRFQIKWDSEESAPSEYPPEQPEVDAQEDDGTRYGVEELEEEEAAIAEAEAKAQAAGGGGEEGAAVAGGAGAAVEKAAGGGGGEDAQMEGVETEGAAEEDDDEEEEEDDDEESDDGSEDLEAESEGEDEEDLEVEEAARAAVVDGGAAAAAAPHDGDHDMEMDEGGAASSADKSQANSHSDVMVH